MERHPNDRFRAIWTEALNGCNWADRRPSRASIQRGFVGTASSLQVPRRRQTLRARASAPQLAPRSLSVPAQRRSRIVQIFGRERSGREAIVVAQHTAEPLALLDESIRTADLVDWPQQM